MRTFIAINLPRELRERLHEALAPLRERLPAIRWLDADALHITLKFLGDIDGGDVERIGATIRNVVSSHEPFRLRITGLGAFPSMNRAAIVWVGAAAEPRLERLQRDLELAMSRLGFAREQRPFRTHLTVGRMRTDARPPSLERLVGLLEYTEDAPVDAVDLMRSHTDAGGARYELLSRYGLGPGDME